MANPFKDIFRRKYTPYYSVEGVDDATKQQIREFGQQLQQDPTRFTEEQAKNITILNRDEYFIYVCNTNVGYD